MRSGLKWLWECWEIPDAEPSMRVALLNRQLRALYKVLPMYSVCNVLTAIGLLATVWPGPGVRYSLYWLVVVALIQGGWGLYSKLRLRWIERNRASFTRKEVYVAALWCMGSAALFAYGIHIGSHHLRGPGTLLLMSATMLGLISTGVLVGLATPLVSLTWLVVLGGGSIYIVFDLGYEARSVTIALFLLYAIWMLAITFFLSRLFVARVKAEFAAEQDREKVSLLLGDFEEGASDWLWESDARGHITHVGSRLAVAFSVGKGVLQGRSLSGLFARQRIFHVPSDREVGADVLDTKMSGKTAFSGVVVEANIGDAVRSWSISAKPLVGSAGERAGWRGVGSEVTNARALELRLHHMATHDALTGLPNRRAFLHDAGHFAELPERVDWRGLALIDLDNFKAINDALGHAAGDRVLRNVAERLRRSMHAGDFLARLGGDEFAMLLRDFPSGDAGDAIMARAESVLEALRIPYQEDGYQIDVRASVGTTIARAPFEDAHVLLQRADIALYAAKDSGRDCARLYQDAMGARLEQRLSLVSDLSVAIERGELEVHYQCIVGLGDQRIIGCEALLRWRHARHGAIAPSAFIPVAEESGLIVPIGLWVLERACAAAATWPPSMMIAVNVSALQLSSPRLFETVMEVLQRHGLPPERLELEITESSVARDDRAARLVLQRLREAGVQLAIDDFGTGYSSMSQLRELPFDRLKLDRSFVAGLSGEHVSATRAIIESLLRLSRSMNLVVTAEGIENQDELDTLRELGCEFGQGYLFAMPQDECQVKPLMQVGHVSHSRVTWAKPVSRMADGL